MPEHTKEVVPAADPLDGQADTPAPPSQPPKAKGSKVHPAARYVAALLSPMSLVDQVRCDRVVRHGTYAVTVASFLASLYIGSFRWCAYAIMATGAVFLVAFLPNWTQSEDRGMDDFALEGDTDCPDVNQWVPREETEAYYEALSYANRFTQLKPAAAEAK